MTQHRFDMKSIVGDPSFRWNDRTIICVIIAIMLCPALCIAAPTTPAIPTAQFGQMILVLLLVLALFIISAYATRRLTQRNWGKGGIKLITGLNLSQKERIVLIEVADKQMLLGVTAQSIQALHVFDEKAITKQEKKSPAKFSNLLQQMTDRGKA